MAIRNKWTTLRLRESTIDVLKTMKIYRKESMEDVLKRLIESAGINEGDKSATDKKNIYKKV